MEDAIASLLRQNASLTNVTLGAFNMSAMASMRLTSTMSPWMAKLLLEGLPESIRKVVMDVEVNNNEPNETVLPTAHDLVLRNHDLLENLTIHWKWNYEIYEADTIFAVAEETVLIPFLYSCTNLKDFGGKKNTATHHDLSSWTHFKKKTVKGMRKLIFISLHPINIRVHY